MRRFRTITFYLLVSGAFILAIYTASAYELPKWFSFNKKNSLQEWQEKIFKNKVIYTIEGTDKNGYLQARSDKACSGLVYKIQFKPKESPIMSWQWKVEKFPSKAGTDSEIGGWIEKDDYAARVYVIFPSWIFTSTRSLEYVWAEDMAEDTIITSPYFGNIKLMVIESGKQNMGQWVYEERNIYEDYKKCFGSEPPMAGAIALMTDTDNTLSTAEASYKEIRVGYKK